MQNNKPTRRAFALALGTGAAATAMAGQVQAQAVGTAAKPGARGKDTKFGATSASTKSTGPSKQRERICIDKDWQFSLGHANNPEHDFGYGERAFFFAKAGYGDGPADLKFDATAWRKLDLPHDWAVELPFDARGDTNHGSKAIGQKFPENSIGWYRKTIEIPAFDEGRRISLEFDGVYRNSVVWVNGHYIGTEPSGYSGFRYDITDYLTFGGSNTVVVRADAMVEEGWFYEGAGIYRHVWLTKTDPLHVAQWGTFVKSRFESNRAEIDIDVDVRNDAKLGQAFKIQQEIFDANGKRVASTISHGVDVDALSSTTVASTLSLSAPSLWSLEKPYMYIARTTLLRGNDVVDIYETPFGVRTVTWDTVNGFSLNGEVIKLQGTNNHQDHAGVGVALPDGLQAWRLKQLKSFGVNAYRASHNPPTPELLDAADRLGMLVIDEHRMMGTTPGIRSQLERMVKRDRNHPSVIIWSVGNEEWALEWAPLGKRLALEMHDIVTRMDPTRRTTVATSASGQGVSLGADVIGFNYGAQHDVDGFRKAHPDMPAMMTEEGSTLTTRGIYFDERDKSHLNAYDRQGRPGNSLSIEEAWRRVQARPWMGGMFIWTGFDYRGETTPFGWPAISSQFGMVDTTGVWKDTAYYLKSVWMDEPTVHILPHWNWPGREGEAIDVRVYSNGDEVELFQDGKSLGRQPMEKDSHLRWRVTYKPGRLTANAYRKGKVVTSDEVVTTGAPAKVVLTADKLKIRSDGTDVSVVWVNIFDKEGRIVPTASNQVKFATTGPIRLIGVGNGDPGSHEPDRPAERHASYAAKQWRALPIDTLSKGSVLSESGGASDWLNPFQWFPPEERPAMKKGLVLTGDIQKPAVSNGDTVRIFIGQLDPNQKVYVDGQLVNPILRDGNLTLDVDPSKVREKTTLSYVIPSPGDGLAGLADRSVAGTKWGIMRVTTPAAEWQRSAFNGWAQVIVQSTGGTGTATLKASASELGGGLLTFDLGEG